MNPEAAEAFVIGDVAFWSILIGSIVTFGLAAEQVISSWKLGEGARALGSDLTKMLLMGNLTAARSTCERSDSPVADIFIAAMNKWGGPEDAVYKAAERERQRLSMSMKRRLWAIGTIGATAPFVGLFGTVVGIIRAFKDIAAAGSGGFSVVASGVSEALVATAGGILIAVLAVVLYNYLQNRANRATVEVRLVVDEFIEQLLGVEEDTGSTGRPSTSAARRPSVPELATDTPSPATPTPAPAEG